MKLGQGVLGDVNALIATLVEQAVTDHKVSVADVCGGNTVYPRQAANAKTWDTPISLQGGGCVVLQRTDIS
jgi:hypothetical protein